MATDYDALTPREVDDLIGAIRTRVRRPLARQRAAHERRPGDDPGRLVPARRRLHRRTLRRAQAGDEDRVERRGADPRARSPARSRSRARGSMTPTSTSGAHARELAADAIARVLDAAVLFGTGAPAEFPPNGVAGAGTPVGGADALAALAAAMAAIEASGLLPNGIAPAPTIGSVAPRRVPRGRRAAVARRRPDDLRAAPSRRPPVWEATRATRSSATGRSC